eukprot:1628182-Rhodomonas_salina.1
MKPQQKLGSSHYNSCKTETISEHFGIFRNVFPAWKAQARSNLGWKRSRQSALLPLPLHKVRYPVPFPISTASQTQYKFNLSRLVPHRNPRTTPTYPFSTAPQTQYQLHLSGPYGSRKASTGPTWHLSSGTTTRAVARLVPEGVRVVPAAWARGQPSGGAAMEREKWVQGCSLKGCDGWEAKRREEECERKRCDFEDCASSLFLLWKTPKSKRGNAEIKVRKRRNQSGSSLRNQSEIRACRRRGGEGKRRRGGGKKERERSRERSRERRRRGGEEEGSTGGRVGDTAAMVEVLWLYWAAVVESFMLVPDQASQAHRQLAPCTAAVPDTA